MRIGTDTWVTLERVLVASIAAATGDRATATVKGNLLSMEALDEAVQNLALRGQGLPLHGYLGGINLGISSPAFNAEGPTPLGLAPLRIIPRGNLAHLGHLLSLDLLGAHRNQMSAYASPWVESVFDRAKDVANTSFSNLLDALRIGSEPRATHAGDGVALLNGMQQPLPVPAPHERIFTANGNSSGRRLLPRLPQRPRSYHDLSPRRATTGQESAKEGLLELLMHGISWLVQRISRLTPR